MSTSKRSDRVVPRVESLELKALLSVALAEVQQSEQREPLQLDLDEFEPTRILVRYSDEAADVKLEPVPGTSFEHEFTLVPGLHAVQLDEGVDYFSTLQAYQEDPLVLYAEPDYIVSTTVNPSDDTFYGLEYGLHNTGQSIRDVSGTPDADIDAPEAWAMAPNAGEGVIVAVIDSGVDYTHEDLADNMWINNGEIPGNGLDDDLNGYVDDVYGYDFYGRGDSDPMDENFHGTHVAGTIAGVDNNVGIIGVAPKAKIMALRFLGPTGSGSTFGAIGAIEYAVSNGATLTNNSWGGGGFSNSLFNAIAAARNAGQVFVAAAGNSGANNDLSPHYPSSYNLDNIISVAATNNRDNYAGFSNIGVTSVDLAAPGVDIASTFYGGGYVWSSGTSMASPHVAGAAAVLLAEDPSLTPQEVKSILLNSVDDLSATGRTLTDGRLNLAGALGALEPDPVVDIAIQNINATPDDLKVGENVEITVDVINTGDSPASFSVEIVSDNGTVETTDDFVIATLDVANLGSGSSTSVNTTWNTSSASTATHTLTASVDPLTNEQNTGNNSASTTVTINDVAPPVLTPKLAVGELFVTNDDWQLVTLGQDYDSMVVVASVGVVGGNDPLVARVRNATGSSFEIKVQRATSDGTGGAINADLHYMVIEEGRYNETDHGVTMEAVRFESTVTDRRGSLVGQQVSYNNSYSSPVVVGQVMTENDSDWSSFWARGDQRTNVPSSSTLFVGKHVGEDTDQTRVDETIGYIVVEAGSGLIDGIAFEAAVGSDSVRGVDNNPPFSYRHGLSNATNAIVSSAAMDGGDGGWPVLYGSNPISSNNLGLAINEDVIGDAERSHTKEQVAYILLGNQDSTASAELSLEGTAQPIGTTVGQPVPEIELAGFAFGMTPDKGTFAPGVFAQPLFIDFGNSFVLQDETLSHFDRGQAEEDPIPGHDNSPEDDDEQSIEASLLEDLIIDLLV